MTSPPDAPVPLHEQLGLCQWFHFEDHDRLDQTVALMDELGARHLRTGVSWADYHRPGGAAWTDHQMATLARAGIEVLLSVWHVPPSLSESGTCAGPPRRLRDYADFVDTLLTRHGDQFAALELWNEPNNRLKWAFPTHDPGWDKFAEMIRDAGYWAQHRGCPTVLGGMIPVDPHWLDLMAERGVLDVCDAVGIHAFPGMWWDEAPNWDWHRDWHGWHKKVDLAAAHAAGRPIWCTETGLATWDLAAERPAKHDLQAQALREAAAALAHPLLVRLYWYCLLDLPSDREAIEDTIDGRHDENEYHLGLVSADGQKKPAFYTMRALLADADPPTGGQPRSDGDSDESRPVPQTVA